MNPLLTANPKLQLVDQLFTLLDRQPHLWTAVAQLARSTECLLTDAVANRMALAVASIERVAGETADLAALKAAVASYAHTAARPAHGP